MGTGGVFLEIKRQRREAENSLPSNVIVRNDEAIPPFLGKYSRRGA
jgi:hypothetical protein